MQIFSLGTRDLLACNPALQQWLGYAPEDIANLSMWAERVCADHAQCRQVLELWQHASPQNPKGESLLLPEMHLRCKDDSERMARGTMPWWATRPSSSGPT